MLAFVGDVHGEIRTFRRIIDELVPYKDSIKAVIQVGDMGWYPFNRHNWMLQKWDIPIYWIDGNHEDHRMLKGIDRVTEFDPNFFFVPRGTVLELDGRRIVFMGGAGSVDAEFNHLWSPGERILDSDIAKLDNITVCDIMVTHCPPQSVIQEQFDPKNLAWFGLPETWRDPSADKIEALWQRLGRPYLICGHMHKSLFGSQWRILNIDEVFCM
jgi:Icc-related predicted phosphoesterase